MDRFVAGEDIEPTVLRHAWQDTTTVTPAWDRPLYAEFFRVVRDVNRTRARAQLRIGGRHGGGNLFSAFGFFFQGRSEWGLTASPPPTIWQGGLDLSFLANVAGLIVVGGAAALAYRGLFKAARVSQHATA